MADTREAAKKNNMFDDLSTSEDDDFSEASNDRNETGAEVPETAVRHLDPVKETPAVSAGDHDGDKKAFAAVDKKGKSASPHRAPAQAARYPSEEPAPLVRHIQAATPQSKTAPSRNATPATTSKVAAARTREEVAENEQEMDPRGVKIELKAEPSQVAANNSLVKRRSGGPSAAATARAKRLSRAEDDGGSSQGSSSSDDDFHVADYVFPRLEAGLINHDRHTAKASKGAIKPPNCVEVFVATMLTIDVRVAVYLLNLFLCLVFTVVSIPTSQLDGVNKSCYTYYGYKSNCDAATYDEPVSLMSCRSIATRLQAGAAFSIIALVLYLVNFVICFIVVFCLREAPQKVSLKSRMVLGAVGAVNVVMHVIPWACVAGIYSSRYCEAEGPRTTAYGVGFGLCLTAWSLNVVSVILVFALPTSIAKRLHNCGADESN